MNNDGSFDSIFSSTGPVEFTFKMIFLPNQTPGIRDINPLILNSGIVFFYFTLISLTFFIHVNKVKINLKDTIRL